MCVSAVKYHNGASIQPWTTAWKVSSARPWPLVPPFVVKPPIDLMWAHVKSMEQQKICLRYWSVWHSLWSRCKIFFSNWRLRKPVHQHYEWMWFWLMVRSIEQYIDRSHIMFTEASHRWYRIFKALFASLLTHSNTNSSTRHFFC